MNYMNEFAKPFFVQNYQNQSFYPMNMFQVNPHNYSMMHQPVSDFIQPYNNMNYSQTQIFPGYSFQSQSIYGSNQSISSNQVQRDQNYEQPKVPDSIVKQEPRDPPKIQKRKIIKRQRKEKQQIDHTEHVIQKKETQINIRMEREAPNVINLEFLRCVCEGIGNIQQKQYFECGNCKFLYHFQCLKINKKRDDACPYCFLTLPRVFSKVVKRPIKFGYFFKKRGKVTIQLTQDEIQTLQSMFENKKSFKQQIQFRLVRITDAIQQQNQKKTYWTIVFNKFHIDKIKKDKLILIEDLNESSNAASEILIVYSISLVDVLKYDQILEKLVSSKQSLKNLQYIKQRVNEFSQEQKHISLVDHYEMPIEYPVRGSNCKHIQVFNLPSFLQMENFRKYSDVEICCPLCNEKCDLFDPFRIDKFIYDEMNKFAASMDASKPVSFLINKSGIITWNFENSEQIQVNINSIKFDEEMEEEKQQQNNVFPNSELKLDNGMGMVDEQQAKMID